MLREAVTTCSGTVSGPLVAGLESHGGFILQPEIPQQPLYHHGPHQSVDGFGTGLAGFTVTLTVAPGGAGASAAMRRYARTAANGASPPRRTPSLLIPERRRREWPLCGMSGHGSRAVRRLSCRTGGVDATKGDIGAHAHPIRAKGDRPDPCPNAIMSQWRRLTNLSHSMSGSLADADEVIQETLAR
jgi:hypothetical protein